MRHPFVTCAVLATTVLGVAPAGAAVSEREHYSGSETFTDDPCSYPLDVTYSYQGSLVMRETDGGQAFRVRDTYSFRAVFTNPANGKWFVVRGHGTVNEVKATHVEGDIYEFVVHESGQPFVLEDADGDVIARDRGLISSTFLFDTLGDGVPGGEFVGDSEDVLHGQHPGFADDFPFCDITGELVGA
jgi:hypothetical protein